MPAHEHSGPAATAVACRGVRVEYRTAAGTTVAVHEADADLAARQLSVIAGPSGSGKSSLLGVVAGLQRPAAGSMTVAGREITRLRPRARRWWRRTALGIVLQNPSDNLIDYLTAREQVELAARLRGTDPSGAAALLDVVGVAHRADRRPHELSGGEQQRVAFAAAAIGGPEVLLADEPTAQLDDAAGATLIEAVRRLVEGGSTVVVASHDPEVIGAADHVVRLADGRVVAS